MQFSSRELFFLPISLNMKFMYTKYRRKKRSSQRRKIHKNLFACSAALPPAVNFVSFAICQRSWHRKNDNYCFWDSFFTISRFRLVAVNLSILFHLLEVAFFFRGWSCCLLCSWFLFLQICLMTIKKYERKIAVLLLVLFVLLLHTEHGDEAGKKVLRVKI